MATYSPPVVISVHGIRTHAKWQKTFGECAGDFNINNRAHDYNYFNVIKFLLKRYRDIEIDRFYEKYTSIVNDKKLKVELGDYKKRPTVVAHSFGTYIVANCMLKHRDVKFDKVILCGSILHEDFDWSLLMARDQVNSIYNECGHRDLPVMWVGKFVRNTGASGRVGFKFQSKNFTQAHSELGHSDPLFPHHMETIWFPHILKAPSGYQPRHGRDIEEASVFAKTLDDAHRIDSKHYAELEHFAEVDIPRGLSLKWIEINPDIYTFIFSRDDNEVKGYINAMPLDEAIFNKIKNGKDIKDNDIKPSDIVPFSSDQTVKMYLMSIAIAPEARRVNQGLLQEALEKLLLAFFDKLIWLAINSRIRVTELVATGWTDAGKRLCKLFGMQEVGRDPYGHPIFWMELNPKIESKKTGLFPGYKRLLETYKTM